MKPEDCEVKTSNCNNYKLISINDLLYSRDQNKVVLILFSHSLTF